MCLIFKKTSKKLTLRRSDVWSRTDTESIGASCGEEEEPVADGEMGVRKTKAGWRTIRHVVRFTPFMNTFRKRYYPWVQVHR